MKGQKRKLTAKILLYACFSRVTIQRDTKPSESIPLLLLCIENSALSGLDPTGLSYATAVSQCPQRLPYPLIHIEPAKLLFYSGLAAFLYAARLDAYLANNSHDEI